MKSFSYIGFIGLLAISLSIGCTTTQEIKGTITSQVDTITSKVSSITSNVDQNLFAQVPEDNQGKVKKAELDLMISEEKVKLADLKEELASTRAKYAGYEQEQAQKYRQEAAITLDIAKTEAIDKSGLGKKDVNIKAIADLKSKKLRMEADRINIEAKLTTTKLQISNLTEQIKVQEEKIKGMESPE
jgi:hypothetical protein